MFPSPDRILSRLVKDHFSPPTHPREVPREVPQNITRYFHGKNEGLSENTTNLMAYHRVYPLLLGAVPINGNRTIVTRFTIPTQGCYMHQS